MVSTVLAKDGPNGSLLSPMPDPSPRPSRLHLNKACAAWFESMRSACVGDRR